VHLPSKEQHKLLPDKFENWVSRLNSQLKRLTVTVNLRGCLPGNLYARCFSLNPRKLHITAKLIKCRI